jgi:signal transduction histidine kinase/DNA-binding response OmpR family regulator/CHASE3 domain sensor protein
MDNTFKRNLIISTTVSILILTLSSVASYMSIQRLMGSNKLVNHTHEVIYNLNSAQFRMTDDQNSMRGFLITGRESFLEKYKGSEAQTNIYLDNLETLTSDNSQQQATLKIIRTATDEFYRYVDKRIKNKKENGITVAADLERGKRLMDELRGYFKRMEGRETGLLKQRIDDSATYGVYTSILIIVAALIAILISSVFFARILKDYKVRLALQQELEAKEKETAERIDLISNVATQIEAGNYKIKVDTTQTDALGSVAESLNGMSQALHESFTKVFDNAWLQEGIAELNNVMLGESDIPELAQNIISFVAQYTESQAGLLYLLENERLVLTAGYSYNVDNVKYQLNLGEGLAGQAVASEKTLDFKTPESDNIKISYALGEAKPGHIVAFPLHANGMVGVIEIATVSEYSEKKLAFFEAINKNIAIAFQVARSRREIQELLEETQSQSEELRVQHTEMESMNAELETQTEKLQASEEELKVQQEELQQTNEELNERSVLLEEQNLEIQKKSEALELSTRYKSEFLANMSHELRTPLNSILLLSRLLGENNDENLSDEQVEFAKVIQSSGNGLLGLIDEILDLSKIEAGKMDLEIIEVPTEDIAKGIDGLFKQVAKEKGIAFSIDYKDAPLVIKTDKMRLEQILKNLISNAIKFTAKGSVTLTISKPDTTDNYLAFAVNDTGIGIPKDQQPLIFEAFQQADGSTKRKYGGTGLGLSISRELARLLRGEITIYSEPGKGSTFTLTIPLTISSATAIYRESAPVIQAPTPVAVPEKKYISETIPEAVPDDRDDIKEGDKAMLIVEDDRPFAKALLQFSRERGYKGIVTVRGDEAYNLAAHYKPLAILLDIQLPIKSGWEVMEELKASAITRHIPVHIMSSMNVRQESLLKGAINFLDKPAAFEQIPEVFKRIEAIVNRESQKVLIIEDNSKHAEALSLFLESNNIRSEISSDVSRSIESLQREDINCVILDMGIPDQQAYEILESVKENGSLENTPVIVFTGKSLSMNEEMKIKKYADSIIVKTAHSYQRMLDEVSLFLHIVEDKKVSNKKDTSKRQLDNVLKDKTVLVVDDDVRNIYSLTKALEVLQMKVVTAIDGAEALKALKEHPETDVVLLDMMMPNLDGYETAKLIRENKKWKTLPVIAVTAKAMTGDREKCINAGASDYITKPVDVDQLLSLLRVWLYS